jgi:hypothetical protein
MELSTLLRELVAALPPLENRMANFRALVGFDGFVDRIQHLVQARNLADATYFEDIATFAQHLGTLAGKSGQVEMVTLETKIGGNAPILANSLASLGIRNYCAGAIGDPVFGQMHPLCEKLPLCPPATTNAFEFGDGKLMFSDMGTFETLDWEKVKQVLAPPNLREYARSSQLLAFVDWANLPRCTSIWRGLLTEVVALQPDPGQHFLFDICDPSRNSAPAIVEVLEVVSGYYPYGQVTLGMNENETRKVWLALHGHSPNAQVAMPSLRQVAEDIFARVRVHTLLVHPTDRSLACTRDGIVELPNRAVAQPKILTGGGDNLNAGYCLGLLAGLPLPHCMVLGMANAGAYIQNGYSPGLAELGAYLQAWQAGY